MSVGYSVVRLKKAGSCFLNRGLMAMVPSHISFLTALGRKWHLQKFGHTCMLVCLRNSRFATSHFRQDVFGSNHAAFSLHAVPCIQMPSSVEGLSWTASLLIACLFVLIFCLPLHCLVLQCLLWRELILFWRNDIITAFHDPFSSLKR